jgi:CheY-like chemotaxis protein
MPRILIVEDNKDSGDSLAGRLQCRGFDVVLAADGKTGVAMAQAERPDLVLMDMNMPEMDGYEATRQLKATTSSAMVPVIALTEQLMPGDRERALEVGCADCHNKPIEFGELLGQIESILQITPVAEPALLAEDGTLPQSA